ncbi:MAG: RibD family protein [Terriglobia bacterium]
MEPITTLLDRQPVLSSSKLTEGLRTLYNGDLHFPVAVDRPYVIANFAATLDGVVSYNIEGQSAGGEISGHNEGDRFIMGLLRASADAVLVGSRTFHEVNPRHLWMPEHIYPEAGSLYKAFRDKELKHPLLVIVSGTGRVDVARAVFHTPDVRALIVTTEAGKRQVDQACADARCSVEVRVIEGKVRVAPEQIIEILHRDFDVRLLLHEGGPELFGEFLQRRLTDELFLTVAPQIAGRDAKNARPALIRNVAFLPAQAPWLRLVSAKNSGDHLYLRYRTPSNQSWDKR